MALCLGCEVAQVKEAAVQPVPHVDPLLKVAQFTDDCAAQYKPRHCIGDLSCYLLTMDSWRNKIFSRLLMERGSRMLLEPMSNRR